MLSVSVSAAGIGYRDYTPLPFLSSVSVPPLHPWTVTEAVTADGCERPIAPAAEQTSLICQNTDVPSWQLRRGALNPVKPNKGVCPLFVMRPARHLPPIPLHSLHKQDKTAVRATLTLMYELKSVKEGPDLAPYRDDGLIKLLPSSLQRRRQHLRWLFKLSSSFLLGVWQY